MNYFEELGIDSRVTANLAAIGLTEPTPIQTRAIPAALDGRDIMGLAQTGTGKTAAFGLPLVTKLLEIGRRPEPKTCRALILAPTRELATQITDNIQKYALNTPVRTFRVVGGASLGAQAQRLASGIDILVATPGRLIDLLERKALKLNEVRYLVLDEADQMLDIGFIHALRQIARLLPPKRQTMLFSATMPKLMDEIAAAYLTNPIRVQVSPPGKVADKIDQGVHFVNQGDKAKLLADYIAKHPGGAIHGNKSQGQRERTLQAFRNGELKVLVATDVAARGIDIPDVRHVYNYDLPNVPENYVHRIGRTARAGKAGRAVAFCAPAEFGELKAIEKVMKADIPVIGGNAPSGAEANAAAREAKDAKGRSGKGRPQQRNDAQKARPAKRPSRRPRRANAA